MTGGTVVILGKTGRNIAAGMSGGRIFILDLDPALVNGEMVDVLVMPEAQKEVVRKIISNHFVETGSQIAKLLLDDWKSGSDRISMVMPRDYARVLAAMDRAEAEGLPRETYVMEVSNG
jgi:glutamate synthase (NADPH/NADH) large chain